MPAPIERRETTTLLTVDGTLLHRDLFTVAPAERSATALDLTLPAGAVLWSARVGGQPVRPLDRGGRVAVPLGPGGAGTVEVEVVSVQERAIPAGRSLLGLDLPEVARPVREHVWRLLLPENARYRYRTGDLQPARERVPEVPPPPSSGIEDAITVTSEAPLLDRLRPRRKEPVPPPPPISSDSFEELKKGLQSGIRPLPIEIPESGKALLLSGVLPPAHVAVELEVRARR